MYPFAVFPHLEFTTHLNKIQTKPNTGIEAAFYCGKPRGEGIQDPQYPFFLEGDIGLPSQASPLEKGSFNMKRRGSCFT